jgi:hypothetical protein
MIILIIKGSTHKKIKIKLKLKLKLKYSYEKA